jgi:D-aminoacyl-tRNA deacylase
MNIAIISWVKDKAGTNIKENLINNFDFNTNGVGAENKLFSSKSGEKFDDNDVFQYKDIKLYTINSEHIYADDLDKKISADLFIFISKHSAVEGRPSLTCHPIGNFGKAEKGGKEKTLCPVDSILLKNIFIELNKNADDPDYEITMEATHHGPFLEKPVLFVEIGSTEKEWVDKNAGSIVAKSVINAIGKYNDESTINNENNSNNNEKNNNYNNNNNNNNSIEKINNNNNSIEKINKNNNLMNGNKGYESVFVIGGGHYNYTANKVMLKTNFAVGHVCAKYNLENLNESLIKQAMEKTIPRPKFVLLEWKGLGKEKGRILDLLEKNNIEHKRSDKFFNNK